HSLGELTLYGTVQAQAEKSQRESTAPTGQNGKPAEITISQSAEGVKVSAENQQLTPTFSAGSIPPSTGIFDREIKFVTPLRVVDWSDGQKHNIGAIVRVQTRPSLLYDRLFADVGDELAGGVESILFIVAIVFAIIELLALFIGTRLTRSIT